VADLRLVGLTDDGDRLILEREGGGQDHLSVDERLRSAVRKQPGSPTRQIQLELESKLTPREIQSLIRSGSTLEEVADLAGVSIDRVDRYAGPILHEREHIAQQAAQVSVGRDDHGAVMLLGELVGHRLEERGVPGDGMHWDAWRRDDGGWEVRLDYLAGDRERSALWVYDPARRTVTPDDDEARWLLEEEEPAPVTQLRPVPDDGAEPTATEADESLAEPAASPTKSRTRGRKSPREHSEGTKEAIETLMRGKETVPDTPAPKRKKKPSVPSWDEILFGSRKPE
jgi:DNA-binding CsgD family transcriptional regulator